MYSSDIVAMGDVPETTSPNEIWGIIENEIPKYLGNQKISYIKVFAAKNKNDITGECRINDEPIKELYHKFIGISSAYNVVFEALKKDKVDLTKEEGAVISTAYGFSENYRVR